MTNDVFIDDIKILLEIEETDIFDKKLEKAIDSAINKLVLNGIKNIDSPEAENYNLALDYIHPFARIRIENITDNSMVSMLKEMMDDALNMLKAAYDN